MSDIIDLGPMTLTNADKVWIQDNVERIVRRLLKEQSSADLQALEELYPAPGKAVRGVMEYHALGCTCPRCQDYTAHTEFKLPTHPIHENQPDMGFHDYVPAECNCLKCMAYRLESRGQGSGPLPGSNVTVVQEESKTKFIQEDPHE